MKGFRASKRAAISAALLLTGCLFLGAIVTLGAHGEASRGTTEGHRFPWRALTWNDFAVNDEAKGVIDQAAAQTETFLGYNYTARATKRGDSAAVAAVTHIDWQGGFDSERSWRRSFVTDRNDQLLRHEQGHLDINEIVLRDLRSHPLTSYPQGRGATLQAATDDLAERLKAYYAARREELRKAQLLYDTQTVSGTSETEQARWNTLLTNALNKSAAQR